MGDFSTAIDRGRGLVRVWDVYRQQWRLEPPSWVPSRVLAALPAEERAAIAAFVQELEAAP